MSQTKTYNLRSEKNIIKSIHANQREKNSLDKNSNLTKFYINQIKKDFVPHMNSVDFLKPNV